MEDLNILLFHDFETLDAFGPAEIAGRLPETFRLHYYSLEGGVTESSHGVRVETQPFAQVEAGGIVLLPGGMGTRTLVDDPRFIGEIGEICRNARYILTVCTGSALLARTGLLSGRKATTNKRAYDWVCAQGADVSWQKRARWVVDGNVYTSSGISAGMDMMLGFVRDRLGEETAREVCRQIEYVWNAEKEQDPFAMA